MQGYQEPGLHCTPTPKCLKRGTFLPNDPSYQDIWLKPQQMILAYVQALQYWAEEANQPVLSEPHPLVMSVRKLRQHIGKYTTFNEHDVFKGLGNALPVTTVLAAKPNAGDMPAGLGASPTILEDLVAPTIILVEKLAGPPTLASHTVRERQEYLQWIQVHSSQKVAAVGSVPYKSGEPWQCHNHSSKQHKRVQHLLEEEWWDLGDVSSSASSKGSPELAPQDEEGKGANPKGCPLGFQEIAECLTARGTPEGEAPVSMDVPEASAAPILLMEPTIAMVISTSMGRDQRMDAVYVSTVTASMEIMNLEAPSIVVGCQGTTVEELAEEDLAEGHPWLCKSLLSILLEALCT